MNTDRSLAARMRELCAELGPDDGMSSHDLKRRERQTHHHRLKRLGGQVQRAARQALASSTDPLLHDLWVSRVTPAPDASRFRLWVEPLNPELDPALALARLHAARGWLRTEVARAVRRRRAPDLCFAWQQAGGEP